MGSLIKSIKIVSDGNSSSPETKILDHDGNPIGGISSVDVHMSTETPIISADITMLLPKMEIEVYDVILNDKRTIEDEIFAEEFFKGVDFPFYEVGCPDPVLTKGDK